MSLLVNVVVVCCMLMSLLVDRCGLLLMMVITCVVSRCALCVVRY